MNQNEPTHETIKAFLKAHHHVILRESVAKHYAGLLPYRSIASIDPIADDVVGVVITELRDGTVHDEREMPDIGFHMLFGLSLLQAPYFNPAPGAEEGTELHYLCVPGGIPFHAVMVGAQPGEAICLGRAHKVLCPEHFTVEAAPRRKVAARERAIEQALAAWDANAERLSLATILPRYRYEEILREIFALYDARQGHLLKRPGKLAA